MEKEAKEEGSVCGLRTGKLPQWHFIPAPLAKAMLDTVRLWPLKVEREAL